MIVYPTASRKPPPVLYGDSFFLIDTPVLVTWAPLVERLPGKMVVNGVGINLGKPPKITNRPKPKQKTKR